MTAVKYSQLPSAVTELGTSLAQVKVKNLWARKNGLVVRTYESI